MNTALTVLLWVVIVAIGLPAAAIIVAVIIGVIKGISMRFKQSGGEK